MARTLSSNTTAALTRASAPHIVVEFRVIVVGWTGGDSDLSTLGGVNWCVEAHITDTVDTPVQAATITLVRRQAGQTITPYVKSSPYNTGPIFSPFEPLLRPGRRIRIDTRSYPYGATPITGDWLPMFSGKIDRVDDHGLGDTFTVEARDIGAYLLDTFIDAKRVYAPTADLPVMTVLQQLLDDNLGAGTETIYDRTPGGFGWNVKKYEQAQVPLLTAMRDIAFQFGGEVRYRWQSDNTFKLVLFVPDRTKTASDWTLAPDDYVDIPAFSVSDADVRNYAICKFVDSSTGLVVLRSAQDLGSQGNYGKRLIEYDEDATSSIDTSAEADAFLAIVLSDLANPIADVSKETRYFPIAELFDLGLFPANGMQYDTDYKFGVVQVVHDFTLDRRRTTVQVKGKVSGSAFGALRAATSSDTDATITSLAVSFTDFWTIPPFPVRVPGVFILAVCASGVGSVKIELSSLQDFSIITATNYVNVMAGQATTLFQLANGDRDKIWYVRATPYSGTLVAGVSSGNAGVQSVASTLLPLRPSATLTTAFGSGASVITAGDGDWVFVSTVSEIVSARLVGSPAGTLTVELWTASTATFPTFTKASASAPLALSGATGYDSLLAGWTVSFPAGTYFMFKVTGTPTTVTKASASIRLARTEV